MTRILDRYIYKEMGPPFLIGVGVFTFFLVIDRIYQLTDLVITKNVPFALVLPLLLYMLPAFLALTLPMALLVTVLLVCGRLAGDLEVAALKASGVSPLRLFRPFLAIAIIITLLISWLTLVVGPWSSGAFQRQLFRIFQSRATTGIKERTFSASFSQFVIYVDEVSASQVRLKGMLVSDERNPEQSRIIVAREGRLLSDEATRRITLRFLDGSINESDVTDRRRFRQTYFSLYDMTLPVDSPLAAVAREEKPEKQLPPARAPRGGGEHEARGPDLRALLRRAAQALRAAGGRARLHDHGLPARHPRAAGRARGRPRARASASWWPTTSSTRRWRAWPSAVACPRPSRCGCPTRILA